MSIIIITCINIYWYIYLKRRGSHSFAQGLHGSHVLTHEHPIYGKLEHPLAMILSPKPHPEQQPIIFTCLQFFNKNNSNIYI